MLYLWLKLAKVLAVALLFTGTAGTFVARDLADRRRFAYFLAGPGLGLSWIAGFALTFARGDSLMTTWVIGSLVLSFVSINVVLWSAGKEARRGPISAALALGMLVLTAALMIFRPE